MRSLKHIPQYTLSDYQRWEGDWELIEGLPYDMSPSPINKHQRLGALLLRQVGNSLEKQKGKCGDCVEVYELDWIIDDTTVVRPDIAIICNEQEDFITSPPILIIEILSASTAYKDKHVKFEIYQQQGVKYYLMADPETKTCSIYILEKGQYREQKDASDFIIHDQCSIHIDVAKALSEL